jgi:hypothetical protein
MMTEVPARPSTRRYNAQFRHDIRDMPWVTTAFLVAEQRACDPCRLASDHYHTAALPPTPVLGCTRPGGCGCWFAAVVPGSGRTPQPQPREQAGTNRRTRRTGARTRRQIDAIRS